MNKGRLLLPVFVLLVASALALTACGGGGESDEGKITRSDRNRGDRDRPEQLHRSSRPPTFVEQNSEGKGKEASRRAKKKPRRGRTAQAESVRSQRTSTSNGEEATAERRVHGRHARRPDARSRPGRRRRRSGSSNEAVEGFANFDGAKLGRSRSKKGLGKQELGKPNPTTWPNCIDRRGIEEASQRHRSSKNWFFSGSQPGS